MNRHQRLAEAFQEIDAALSDGDTFHDPSNISSFRKMMARWERTLKENETMERLERKLGIGEPPPGFRACKDCGAHFEATHFGYSFCDPCRLRNIDSAYRALGSPQAFTAPCQNDMWQDTPPHHYKCGGTLHFKTGDIDAPCDRCGGRCGWMGASQPSSISNKE